ncbi:CynX/NimT family MFS transporter [Arthrobacter sp. VKM Ac-2550]|uniref:MFS transporter n=1 Tax=Crystallibacter permensis TaxID=1938888 RepID=UPI0022273666|nr:MFS transporter [Arthrobacter sp. VKM Ac-2550]MCW2135090.1 putative arabinose efflux permease, MFS family [Arthrobacter sp. VKM Ac-2550]
MGNAADSDDLLGEDHALPMPSPRRHPGRLATAMAASTTIVAVLPVFLVGGLAVQLEDDLGMSTAILGAGVAVFWAVSALLSPAAGRVAQRLGARKGMLVAVVGGLAALSGIAFATPHWAWLFVWLAVGGVANALGHPPSNGLIVDQVAVRNRAFAFGLKQAAVPAATLIAGLSVPVLALTVGWKWTFTIGAAFALLLVPVLIGLVPAKRRAQPAAAQSQRSAGPSAGPLPRKLKSFLIVTAIAAAMGSAQANALGAFTVISATQAGFDVATAGLLLGVGSAAGCLTRPLVGMAADRGIGGSMGTVAIMMSMGCVGLLAIASGNQIAFAAGCIFAFGFGWGWNGLVHYVVSHRSHPFTARATGIAQSGTYIGGSLGPLAFGIVLAGFGPTVAWTSAAILAAMGAGAALLAHRLEKQLSTPTAISVQAADEPNHGLVHGERGACRSN